jgi:hypothetical protein
VRPPKLLLPAARPQALNWLGYGAVDGTTKAPICWGTWFPPASGGTPAGCPREEERRWAEGYSAMVPPQEGTGVTGAWRLRRADGKPLDLSKIRLFEFSDPVSAEGGEGEVGGPVGPESTAGAARFRRRPAATSAEGGGGERRRHGRLPHSAPFRCPRAPPPQTFGPGGVGGKAETFKLEITAGAALQPRACTLTSTTPRKYMTAVRRLPPARRPRRWAGGAPEGAGGAPEGWGWHCRPNAPSASDRPSLPPLPPLVYLAQYGPVARDPAPPDRGGCNQLLLNFPMAP